MSRTDRAGIGAQLVVAAVFAVLGIALLAVFVRFAEPGSREHKQSFSGGYPVAAMEAAIAPDSFEKKFSLIEEAGTSADSRQVGRYSGSPGFERTEKLILEAFKKAGLEVKTQQLGVVVPVTEYCEILDEDGKPLKGVTLYPFMPCGLTPTVVAGATGELAVTESGDLKHLTGHDPSDTIVLTYLDSVGDWKALGARGVKAVIVMEDEAARKLRASVDESAATWGTMVSQNEVSYPRFLARGPLADYAGKRLSIRCKVTWQEKKVRNLVGVLRGARQASEALVISTYYDSNSLVPELAPGAEQAVSLALFLQYVEGLSASKASLSRDVIFVAAAGHAQTMSGATRLMEAISHYGEVDPINELKERLKAEEGSLVFVKRAQELLKDDALWQESNAAGLSDRWAAEDPSFKNWFVARVKTVAGEICLDRKEDTLTKRLAYLAAGRPVFRDGFDDLAATDAERRDPANTHPQLKEFLDTQEDENRAGNLVSLPFLQLVSRAEFRAWSFKDRIVEYVDQLQQYHTDQVREVSDSIALHDVFASYARTLTLNLELNSGGSRGLRTLNTMIGIPVCGSIAEPQVSSIVEAVRTNIPVEKNQRIFEVIHWGAKDAAGSTEHPNPRPTGTLSVESAVWTLCGRLSFSILNYEFMPPRLCTPEDVFDGLTKDGIKAQLLPLGKAILAMAHGEVEFKNIPADRRRRSVTPYGYVYGRAAAGTVFPNHPMGTRTFVRAYMPADERTQGAVDIQNSPDVDRSFRLYPILIANPYGEYKLKYCFGFTYYSGWNMTLTVDAARFDKDGNIIYFKDAAPSMQAIAKNNNISGSLIETMNAQLTPVNVLMFRCSRVEVLDQSNPKTLKVFKGISYLGRQGLNSSKSERIDTWSAFLDPDFLFYIGLLDGTSENEQMQEYRSFMFNVKDSKEITPDESELFGEGYLAATAGNIVNPHIDAAESMLRTNEKRIRLLKRYGMTDELIMDFHARGLEWVEIAKQKFAAKEPLAGQLAASKSLSYSINNHPVIRKKVAHAVIGILWYLGLLVPFVFFFEKLIFGFTDIRKQLLASGIIFLVVFALLRLFHPAFEMVRSSIMILLGFVMLLLTLLVTLMVGGKFKQNIHNLRSREGRVEGADVNRGGVIGTAFMLGLNNMRRRKVRTGLTSVTLVLITFVMICFTSVSTDLVNVEYATGRSAWNGLFIRNANYLSLTMPEISVIKQTYGEQYPVRVTSWLTALLQEGALRNAEIVIDREFFVQDQKIQKRSMVSASVCMDWNEPHFLGVDRLLLTHPKWFPRPPTSRQDRMDALTAGFKNEANVILPDTVARDLDITVEDVNSTNVVVTIRGEQFTVLGIIDSVALDKQKDLDGKSILPYDLGGVQRLGKNAAGVVIVPEDTKPLSASRVILVNRHPKVSNEQVVNVSCSVLFPKDHYKIDPTGPEFPAVGFKDQRRLVLEYLERTGMPAYYAVDGVSFYGSRTRSSTLGGMLELLIPILIAALTVFNTMRGSVYERRDEIYVYNAVGIAPNHVFFMFMAEACVYAVVGAMLGYLLSQASGRVLTALNLTGGLNMSYSSIETIYASLTIVAAVLLSTLLPARDAARLASPSDSKGWTIPKAVNDMMEFDLPFTFTQHERVAVISYFHRWLDSNGEGSSGPFFSNPPTPCLRKDAKETRTGHLLPSIQSTIWLKPYDLGVSQRMEIWLPSDPETGEYVAHVRLIRLSGTSSAWERTVGAFLTVLRKQFLNWRAATPADRDEMYAEARELLKDCVIEEEVHG